MYVDTIFDRITCSHGWEVADLKVPAHRVRLESGVPGGDGVERAQDLQRLRGRPGADEVDGGLGLGPAQRRRVGLARQQHLGRVLARVHRRQVQRRVPLLLKDTERVIYH